MPKVLISDKMSPKAAEIFQERGVEVDVKTGLNEDELCDIIGEYDGLAIRSATTVTKKILAAAKNLKVIGRAGIGTDNIDKEEATKNGVIVMNTPFGNSITTAEHAISMMMALARKIPAANASTHAGKWEKSKFMGVEVYGKTLGLVGCGNIGSIVADRAQGLKMKVVAYDPFLTEERAGQMNVEKVELDELFARADFITLHTPLTDSTRNIISKEAMEKMKPGVRIINCARGGLIDEDALKAAIESGHVAGAALDVFSQEPATENVVFGLEEVVCTPHLGASTDEAQENVAIQVAEQLSDYLTQGSVTNALNVPSVSAEDAAKLNPYITLGKQLGHFAGQLVDGGIKSVKIEYEGQASKLNTKPITSVILAGVFANLSESVNMVNASVIAKELGIEVSAIAHERKGNYQNMVAVTIETEKSSLYVAGTLYGDNTPRIVKVGDVKLDAALGAHMIYVNNEDKPGLIGNLGKLLGDKNINIANFHLGRGDGSTGAIALVEVDETPDDALMQQVKQLPSVIYVRLLNFS